MSAPLINADAVLYGNLIDAAYAMFDSKKNSLTPAPTGLPGDYEVVAWIDMTDTVLVVAEHKFYGIIAHSPSNPGTFVVAIRGTEGILEWIEDAFFVKQSFSQGFGEVASGFDQIYNTLTVIPRLTPTGVVGSTRDLAPSTLSGTFAEQVQEAAAMALPHLRSRGIEAGSPSTVQYIAAGHSLGAALATLYAAEHGAKAQAQDPAVAQTTVRRLCTFASPRVGDGHFVSAFDGLGMDSWHIVNTRDAVPKLPFTWMGFGDVATLYAFDSDSFAQHNVGCRHHMRTYLHWLDPSIQLSDGCSLAAAAPAAIGGSRGLTEPIAAQQPERITVGPPGTPITINIYVGSGSHA